MPITHLPSLRCNPNILLSAAFVLMLFVPALVVGQGSTPARGFQPGASYAISDIETINTTNGNLSLNFPLGKLPAGRGGLSGQISLHYSSKLYDSKTQWYQDWDHVIFGAPHLAIRNLLVTSEQGGWRYGTGYELQLINRMNQYPPEIAPQYPATETIRHYKVQVVFPDGSVREFLPRGFGSPMDEGYYDTRPDGWQSRFNGSYVEDVPYLTNTLTYYSFDGTYIRLEVEHDSDAQWGNNPWTLYLPDGTKVTHYGKRITDRNGNYVELSNITYNGQPATQLMDQMGRKVILGWENNADVIRVPGVGGDVVYRIRWKAIQVYKTYSTVINDHFSPTGYPDMLGQQFVVSEIELPAEAGGLKYIFGYNAADTGSTPCCTTSYGWGELNSVTTPTGAHAQYHYYLDGQNGPGFEYTWDNILRNQITQKTLTYQQQNDGGSTPVTETWVHSVPSGTIINPDGGVVQQFGYGGRNFRTEFADGTVVEKIWQTNQPQGFSASSVPDEYTGISAYDRPNDYVKTEFTSIRDAAGNLTRTAIKDYSYDKNGNVTSVREYDWMDYAAVPRGGPGSLPTGIPASAVLKRLTTNSYVAATPDASDTSSNDADSYWNSASPALKHVIASSEISNGSTTLTRAEFFYDNPATTGNLTQQKNWDSTKGAYSNPLTGSNSISTSTQYNQYGGLTLTTDARGLQTRIVYGSVGGFTDLYPTQVQTGYQTAVQRTETREYDFYTGVVTRVTDVDNNVAIATTYDVFGRPTLVKTAEGKVEETRTATEYSDVNRRVIVRSDLSSTGDGKLVSIRHYDQMGRIRLARQLENATTQNAYDETTGIKVETRYLAVNPCAPANTPGCLAANSSALGSYQLVSNPFRAPTSAAAASEASMGWTRSLTDKGGRIVAVETFGGAGLPAPWGANSSSTGVIVTSYDANATTVMDQAGKLRRSLTDSRGRLVRVDEPDANGILGSLSSPNQPTNYAYDALDSLITVNQGNQQRTFVYDSVKRLTSATNPESGTISYRYDDNSNLLVKTDARTDPSDANKKVSTHFEYDLLNRLTRRWYNGSSSVAATTHNSPSLPAGVGATAEAKFYYDNQVLPGGAPSYSRGVSIGRLVAQTYGSGSNGDYYGYDVLGRQTLKIQQTGTINYQITAAYTRSGAVSSLTYPSGRTITNTFDAAGRLISFSGNLGDGFNRTYSTGIVYSSWGSMLKEQFGTSTPVYHKLHYNSRSQLCDVRASNVNDEWGGELGAIVNYYSTNLAHCGSGSDNNGNVLMSQTIINSVYFEDRYGYDSLNRLTGVSEYQNGTSYVGTQQYDYDRWGNRTIKPVSTLGTNKQFTVNSANNRLGVPGGQPGVMTYDQAGNLINDTYTGAGNRTYDAENKITSALDNNNQTATYVYDVSGNRIKRTVAGVETWQIYGIGGELLAEYPVNGAATNPQKEYGYRNGQLLVTLAPDAIGNVTRNVVWTNAAGVSVNGNSLTKTAADNWGNSGGRSTHTILSGNGYVQFTASETVSFRMIGLSTGDSNQDYTDIDFAVYLSGTNLCIYEAGINRGCVSTYVNGDVIKVAVENGVVKYRKNGAVVHTSSVTPTYPLLVDTALWSNGGTLNNVALSGNLSEGTSVNWLVPDHLGTPRMIIDQTGTLANVKRHDYLPFGEELFGGTNANPGPGGRKPDLGYGCESSDPNCAPDTIRQQFTSKERDNETELDYFNARYYGSFQGRFMSVDPGKFVPADPQSWHRYAYTQNNPLKYVDITGKDLYITGNYAEELVKELELKSGYKLNYNAQNGHVTIDRSQKRNLNKTSKTLASALNAAITSQDAVPMYTVSESNDKVAIVQDRFATRQLDIDDYRVLNRDAPELAAGFLTHVLTEYTVAAVTHIPFNFEVLFQVSHQVALSEEAKAVSDMTGKLTTPRSDKIIQGNFHGPSMTSRDDYTSIQYDVIFKTGANGRTTQLESVTMVKPNKKGSSKP